jgi:hypothetical protein
MLSFRIKHLVEVVHVNPLCFAADCGLSSIIIEGIPETWGPEKDLLPAPQCRHRVAVNKEKEKGSSGLGGTDKIVTVGMK